MPPEQPLSVANMVPNRDKAYCVSINGCSKRKRQGGQKSSISRSGDNEEDLAKYMSSASSSSSKDRAENPDGSKTMQFSKVSSDNGEFLKQGLSCQ